MEHDNDIIETDVDVCARGLGYGAQSAIRRMRNVTALNPFAPVPNGFLKTGERVLRVRRRGLQRHRHSQGCNELLT